MSFGSFILGIVFTLMFALFLGEGVRKNCMEMSGARDCRYQMMPVTERAPR